MQASARPIPVLARRLFAPAPAATGIRRQRSTYLAIVAVLLGAVLAIMLPLTAVPLNNGIIAVGILIILLGCVCAYALNHLNHVMTGGWLLVGAINLGVAYYILMSGGEEVAAIEIDIRAVGPGLLTATLVAVAVIDAAAAIFVGLVSSGVLCGVAVIVLSGRLSAGYIAATLAVPVALIMVVAVMAWLFERNRQELIAELTARNAALEESSARIAHSRTIETGLAGQINDLSSTVADTFLTQAQGAADQLSAVIEVTTTLEELDYTAEQISSASSQVASTAQDALTVAEQGSAVIRRSLDATTILQQKVERISRSMSDLKTQAQQIGGIIEIITDVADETNLLALNATIEAAGAREYGRRFSAVANEVQRLANRTREAADEVRGVIGEVLQAVEQVNSATQDGVREAASLVQGTGEIEQAVENVVTIIQNTALLARQITFSIQQQKSASGQVVETMRQISEVSQTVAQNSLSLTSTVERLSAATDSLGENTAPPPDPAYSKT